MAFGKLPAFIALVVGIVAALVLLVAAVYFVVALPPALDSAFAGVGTGEMPVPHGFMGRGSVESYGFTVTGQWGPSLGWFITLIAFVLALVGAAVFMRSRKVEPEAPVHVESLPPEPPAPPGFEPRPPQG